MEYILQSVTDKKTGVEKYKQDLPANVSLFTFTRDDMTLEGKQVHELELGMRVAVMSRDEKHFKSKVTSQLMKHGSYVHDSVTMETEFSVYLFMESLTVQA